MRRLLNTLYVTTPGARLIKNGENLVAEVEDEERVRVPFHMLGSVVVFGSIYISPPLIQACASGGITLVLLLKLDNEYKKGYAKRAGPVRLSSKDKPLYQRG